MKSKLFLFAFLIFAVSMVSAVTSAQRRAETDKPITGDFKITIKNTIAGQTSQSTTMIKGKRERTETSMAAGSYSMTTVNITQCDMRRTIQINDSARKYLITPFETDDSATDSTNTVGAPAGIAGPRRGGVVNMTVNTIVTGERKEMFGFTARRMKRTTIMESSADACYSQKMKIETDGWYINLEYGLSCGNAGSSYSGAAAGATCRDRYVYKRTGPVNLGYPLVETATMFGPDGNVMHTMTKEVVEITRQTQDAALFDIPAGYTAAKDQQEMYAAATSETTMPPPQSGQPGTSSVSSVPSSTANTPARVRVGVVQINNKTKASVSTDSLQSQLVAALNNSGVDAIALNASSPTEAVIEAKAKQCAYILYTDIATLKAPSTGKKIGGLLGRATGVGSADGGKSEVRLDFRLLPTEGASPKVQSSASAKEETQDASLNSAIQSEARAVAAAIPGG